MRLSGVIFPLPGVVGACLTPTCWGRACAGPSYQQCRPTQPHCYPAYTAACFLGQPAPAPVWPCYPMFRSVARPASGTATQPSAPVPCLTDAKPLALHMNCSAAPVGSTCPDCATRWGPAQLPLPLNPPPLAVRSASQSGDCTIS